MSHFNAIRRPFLVWAKQNNILVLPILVPLALMKADTVSRWKWTQGDVSPLPPPQVFQTFLHYFDVMGESPQVDMFASPQNTKLPTFTARFPHDQASHVDALACHLGDL